MISYKFCAAPFRGFYQGEGISVCCQAPVLVDSINSPKIENLRQSFLSKKFPTECSHCTETIIEDTNKMCNLWDNTDYSFYKPVFLDLMWSNKCNFSCLGCTPHISTGMHPFTEAVDIAHEKKHERQRSWNVKYDLNYILKNLDSIKIIHLNGGEPFLQEGFYDLLEKLVEYNATNIYVWSHTNGSVTTYKNRDMIDLLKKFSNCSVIMSNDGVGKRGEYVRYGLKESVWFKNFKRMQDAGITVKIQSCYNVFNALHIDKMADIFPVKAKLTHWVQPLCYSGKYLQNTSLYDKAMLLLEENKNRFRGTENVIKFMKEKNSTPNRMSFSESISLFDRIRGTDFLKTFPELEELYY